MGVVPPIDISIEQHETILMLLQRYLPGTTAWVYGSRAKWTSRPGSDLDLVVFAQPGQYNQVGELREAFEESNLPFRVDLFVWGDIPDSFRKNIREQHVELIRGREEASNSIAATRTLAESEEASEKIAGWLFRPSFPAHWQRRSLYSMATWINGLAFRNIQFSDTGLPVIKIAEIKRGISGQTKFTEQAFDESALVKSGDLLFSWSGQPETSIDAFWWRGPEGWLNQHIFRVIPTAGIDNDFFFYLLRYLKPNFIGIARNKQTTGLGHVAKRDIENLKVACPALPEQHAIAHILGTLDDKIELNRRMNETLEAMTQAIFKNWFVDFGPTREKMESKEPYLPSEIWDLFPDALDDEGKPVGWERRRLGNILELAHGKSFPAKNRMPGNVPVYGSGGVIGTHNTALIDGPAVIVGRKETVGTLHWEDGPAFPIDTVFYVIPRIGSLLFSYHMLASQPLRDMNTDAAVPGLNRKNVYRLEFALPSFALASAFDELAGPIWERRSQNLKETQILEQTRDLLLPKLISGNIRLTEAEKAIEAVV